MQVTRVKPIPQEKIKALEELKKLFKEYPNFLVISLKELPNDILQKLRKEIRDKHLMKAVKKRITYKALKETNKKEVADKILEINETFAIIFTKDSVFKVFKKYLDKEYRTFAKGGEIAEEDIIVKKGPTDLKPGQVVSELARFKIRTRPVQGKLEIIQDVKVLEAGKVISKSSTKLSTTFLGSFIFTPKNSTCSPNS
jgi:large subunit ribosomal protein L10